MQGNRAGRRLVPLLLTLVLTTACTATATQTATPQRHQATFLDLFDTVTTVVGYGDQATFAQQVDALHQQLLTYHQYYDIYHNYDGVNNLKTINDQAGIAPVPVDEEILDLLTTAQGLYQSSGGTVNVAMGAVLTLWHSARTAALDDPTTAAIPTTSALEEAQRWTDMGAVEVDREHGTVYLPHPEMSLDVGALAKGYALEQVCQSAPRGLLISVGGNVRGTGGKDGGDTPWVVGIQDPEGEQGDHLCTVQITDQSVVSSGSYQRYFTVDGVEYHHIIHPETAMPSQYHRAVAVICPDSGLADGLSTALFNLPQKEGAQLLAQYPNTAALWVGVEGDVVYSDTFQSHQEGI